MYIVDDDMGILASGTKLECREAVIEWLLSGEAVEAGYTSSELSAGIEYFKREEASSFMGFTIQRMDVECAE